MDSDINKYTKDIDYKEIDKGFVAKINLLAKDYKQLLLELDEKRKTFLEYKTALNNSLEKLATLSGHDMSEEDKKESEAGFKYYNDLLSDTINKCAGEYNFFEGIISEEHPKTIKVLKSQPDDFEEVIKWKIKDSRSFFKKVRKDLRVSFSQLKLGFDQKLTNLKVMELYLKRDQENKKDK